MTALAPPGRTVRVAHLMGTAFSIDVRGPRGRHVDRAIDAVVEALAAIERVFSPWLPDSEISRIGDGRLDEADASPDVRFVLAACDHLATISDRAFDVRRHRADGRLDPSGFVKGWAVEEAVCHFDAEGLRDYAVNAGGDILVRGDAEPDSGRGWRVGIRDPRDATRTVATLRVRGAGVATSGLYERGAHIRDPRRSGPNPAGRSATPAIGEATESLTVVGPSLAWADAYATAGFALGDGALAWLGERPGYGGLAVTTRRELRWTETIEPLLA